MFGTHVTEKVSNQ